MNSVKSDLKLINVFKHDFSQNKKLLKINWIIFKKIKSMNLLTKLTIEKLKKINSKQFFGEITFKLILCLSVSSPNNMYTKNKKPSFQKN